MSRNAAPAVSILVSAYNRAALLELALKSVLLQDFTDYEVWVVGDGCTDNSGAVVEALGDSRFHWVNLERNHRTPHAAYNEGLRRARGEFIAYHCQDDLWFPWHLSSVVAHLRRNAADLVYDISVDVDPPQEVTCRAEQVSFERTVLAHMTTYVHRRGMADGQVVWRDPYEVGWMANAYFLLDAHRKGCRISFVERLGAITCGSGSWNTYAATEFPQTGYLARMRDDPHALAEELLLANAARAWRQKNQDDFPTLGDALRRVVRRWIWWAYHAWGPERTPARQLRMWHFLRQRRRFNRARGLPF